MTENVKIVMRHLPRFITETEVLQIIGEFPPEVLSYYFSPADISFEPLAFASMYIVFSSFCDSLFEFEKRFEGYIFVDSKGIDSMCNIEVATYQSHAKCNRDEMKKDSKCGKITEESYFKKFMKKLEETESTPIITLEQQILRLGRGDDAKTQLERLDTPLVKFIYNEQIEKQQAKLYRNIQREAKRSTRIAMDSAGTSEENGRRISGAAVIRRERKAENIGSGRGDEKKGEPRIRDKEKEKEKKKEKKLLDPVKLEKKRERDAIRKQKFLEKKWMNDHGIKPTPPEVLKEAREVKKKEYPKTSRNYRAIRETPKNLGDHVGEDWIKRLTDPKSNLRKSSES